MRKKYCITAVMLTLILAGCGSNTTSKAVDVENTTVVYEESEELQSIADESIENVNTEMEISEDLLAGQFKSGHWMGTIDSEYSDGEIVNYNFFVSETGSLSGDRMTCEEIDGEIYEFGEPFVYEPGEDGNYVFHVYDVDDNTSAVVTFTDSDHAVIAWGQYSDEISFVSSEPYVSKY